MPASTHGGVLEVIRFRERGGGGLRWAALGAVTTLSMFTATLVGVQPALAAGGAGSGSGSAPSGAKASTPSAPKASARSAKAATGGSTKASAGTSKAASTKPTASGDPKATTSGKSTGSGRNPSARIEAISDLTVYAYPAIAGSSPAIQVEWTPATDEANVNHYEVVVTGTAGCVTTDLSHSCVVTGGVTARTTYANADVKVTAYGTSDTSAPIGAATNKTPTGTAVTTGPPIAPTSPTVVALANGDATVSWTKVPDGATNRGSAGIASYTAQAFDSAGTNPISGKSCTSDVNSDPTAGSGDDVSCDIPGLVSGTQYTFKVRSNGASSTGAASSLSIPSGTSDWSAATSPALTFRVPPAAPTNVTGVAHVVSGVGDITASWTRSATLGEGITGYTVNAYTASSGGSPVGSCTVTYLSNSATCNIANLAPNATYYLDVTANGTTGLTAVSKPRVSVTAGVPGAPTGVTAVPGANSSIAVTWTAPADTGTGITGYTAAAVGPGSSGTCPTAANVLTCTITGLQPRVAYTVTVVATDSAGDSAASSSASATTGPPATPAAPTATVGASGVITLAWTDLTDAQDGPGLAAGTGAYTGKAYASGSTTPAATCSAAAGAQTCTFSSLTMTSSYTFTLTANGTGTTGSSAESLPSSPAITPGAPGPPSMTSATAGAGSKVTVVWGAPAYTGTPAGITGYTVKTYDAVGANLIAGKTCSPTPATGTTCDVTGLTPGTTYTFRVVATSAAGESPPSALSSATLVGPPGTPVITNVYPGHNTLTVFWTTPNKLTGTTYGAGAITGLAAPITTGCTAGDITTCTITGLTDGTPYEVRVVATGPGSTGTATSASVTATPANVSGPPVIGAVTLSGNTATVNWTAGALVGTFVKYVATAYSNGVATALTCESTVVGTTSCQITGLANGTTYTFRVVTVSDAGTSPPSADSAELSPGPPGKPGKPAVAAVPGTPTSATVTWIAPVGGAAPTSYTVYTYADGVLTTGNCPVTGTAVTCTATGLSPGVQYTFKVVANGVNGSSDFSDVSDPYAFGTPTAPTAVTAVAGNASAVVSWTPSSNAGAGIAKYTATAYTTGGATTLTCSADGATANHCTVTGLTNGTAYTFKVVAVGVAGGSDSPASGPSAEVTPSATAMVPGAPTIGTVTAGDTTATVNWTAPSNLGSGISQYTATAYSSGTATTHTCVAPSTGSSCLIVGLTNGTKYTFKVVANGVAGAGNSPESGASAEVTPVMGNGPQQITVVAANNQLTVSWVANTGSGTGGATATVDHYRATATPVLGGTSGSCDTANATALSCAITGLDTSKAYTVSVVAVFSGGGTSDPGTAPQAFTPAQAALDPPTSVNVVAGDEQITVDWTPPADDSGVARYIATASPGGAVCATPSAEEHSCTIIGLTGGVDYTVTVVSVGTNGASSPDSDPSVTVTPYVKLTKGPIATDGTGRQWLFALGVDQSLYASYYQNDSGKWTTPAFLGRAFATAPVAVRNADGRMVVFSFSTNGYLYYKMQKSLSGTTFGPYTKLGGTNIMPSSATFQVNSDGRIEIFARGKDNAIWHITQKAPSSTGFSSWSSLGGKFSYDPVAMRDSDGRLDVYVIGADGVVYRAYQVDVGGATYTDWTSIDQVASGTGSSSSTAGGRFLGASAISTHD